MIDDSNWLEPPELDLATCDQMAEELVQRPNQQFIFLYKNTMTGNWSLSATNALDVAGAMPSVKWVYHTLKEYLKDHGQA
jgi:hypothetical protein